ncbi:lytic transglycosylase domain-containing protein [Cupriavidus pauculus]|uniref:lytic transglycosylase domain-containing protein n=1 Tax=Cupriavidus pauculus TaxID=82633 RepID=UPI0038572173
MIVDLPTLVQQCASQTGPVTMLAIVKTESGGNPWVIGDNTGRRSLRPASKQEAVATANELIAAGHNLDLGLGQINNRNLTALGLTVEQVFEPCTNLKAAETILKWGYDRAKREYGPGQNALLAALSAYNTGSLSRGFGNGYVQKVVDNAGLPVAISIPAISVGAIVRGKAGAVRVGAGGRLTPYAAPLVPAGWTPPAAEEAANTADADVSTPMASRALGQLVPATFTQTSHD